MMMVVLVLETLSLDFTELEALQRQKTHELLSEVMEREPVQKPVTMETL